MTGFSLKTNGLPVNSMVPSLFSNNCFAGGSGEMEKSYALDGDEPTTTAGP